MATVTDQDIPPDLMPLLSKQLIASPAPFGDTVSVKPNKRARRKRSVEHQHPTSVGFGALIQHMIRLGLVPSASDERHIYHRIAEDLRTSTLDPDIWMPIGYSTRLIERSFPDVRLDRSRAKDPWDRDEIKPTWATWKWISEEWIAAEDSVATWGTEVSASGWISDTHLDSIVYYGYLPEVAVSPTRRPIIGHVTGTVEIDAEYRGARSWFTPSLNVMFHETIQKTRFWQKPSAYTGRGVIPKRLVLPPASNPWHHTQTIDQIIWIDITAPWPHRPDRKAFRVSIAPMPSFGRYTAGNEWIHCEARLFIQLYTPTHPQL